jgi:hypothetical protein
LQSPRIQTWSQRRSNINRDEFMRAYEDMSTHSCSRTGVRGSFAHCLGRQALGSWVHQALDRVQVGQFWSWSTRRLRPWWATRPSSKAAISSLDSEIVPGIAQPALIELFVDPRNAIQRKLAQWSLKTILTARASYQDRRVKLSEFLHAYEDMGLSTAAVARQYFCTMALNLPYIASWARLVGYYGDSDYRPYEEWQCTALPEIFTECKPNKVPRS